MGGSFERRLGQGPRSRLCRWRAEGGGRESRRPRRFPLPALRKKPTREALRPQTYGRIRGRHPLLSPRQPPASWIDPAERTPIRYEHELLRVSWQRVGAGRVTRLRCTCQSSVKTELVAACWKRRGGTLGVRIRRVDDARDAWSTDWSNASTIDDFHRRWHNYMRRNRLKSSVSRPQSNNQIANP